MKARFRTYEHIHGVDKGIKKEIFFIGENRKAFKLILRALKVYHDTSYQKIIKGS